MILKFVTALGVALLLYGTAYNSGFNHGYELGYAMKDPRGIFPNPSPSPSPNPCDHRCELSDARCIISRHFRCEMLFESERNHL